MKARKGAFILLMALLLLGGRGLVFGERFIVHANGGVSFPKEDNVKSGLESGFGFSFTLDRRMLLSFDFGYWKSDVEEEPGKLHKGKLSVTPFLVSLQVSLFEKKAFNPYIFAGAGYVFYDFKIKDIITIPEVTITQKIENGLSLHAGLGALVQILDRLDLFGEALYLYRKGDGQTTISDMNKGTTYEDFSLDMSAFLFRLGIKYRF